MHKLLPPFYKTKPVNFVKGQILLSLIQHIQEMPIFTIFGEYTTKIYLVVELLVL